MRKSLLISTLLHAAIIILMIVDIDSWADAEGEQLTITTKDGKRYLVSSFNCVLVEETE